MIDDELDATVTTLHHIRDTLAATAAYLRAVNNLLEHELTQ